MSQGGSNPAPRRLRLLHVLAETGYSGGEVQLRLLLEHFARAPIIFGNGSQIRDFIFVEDVARANISALNSKVSSGFFNIGTGITTSIQQLAQTMIELSGLELKPQYEKPLDGDVQESQADIRFAKLGLLVSPPPKKSGASGVPW